MISSESPHLLHGLFSEIQCDRFRSQTAPHSWVTAPWPWSTSGLRCVVSVDVSKTTQKKSSQDPPPQKEHINMWSKKSIRLKNKVSWRTSEVTKIDRDMWQNWSVLEKMCRVETSFLISLTFVSNNNDWPPWKFHKQLRVILTHIPTLPIHNGRTTWSWSERERHTHTTNSETRIERKRERKRKNPEENACYFRVSQQTLDLIHCQSKLNRTSHASAQGAEIHHSRVGDSGRERKRKSGGKGGGENKRVRGPVG